jgi:transcriptional regulator with XRE-family HTH domain
MKVYKSRLKYRREDAGLSQAELSAQSGVSLRSIQMYEQGQRDINRAEVVTVLRMAEALKCDIRDIINPW